MKPRDPRIVEMLNDALTLELTIVNTYFLHARMLDNWGLPRLGKVFYDLSIGEMKDADAVIERILLFDGHPNVQRLNPISIGENAHEMLTLGLAGEVNAVQTFNAFAAEARSLGDNGTAAFFDAAVLDEEEHADWFEAQLAAIEAIGLQAYLAQQVEPGTAP
jgi:bacterioferritin